LRAQGALGAWTVQGFASATPPRARHGALACLPRQLVLRGLCASLAARSI
jgi:hypothetical protein